MYIIISVAPLLTGKLKQPQISQLLLLLQMHNLITIIILVILVI